MKMLLDISGMKLNQEERTLLMKSAKARFNFFRNGCKNLMDEYSETEPHIPREAYDAYILKLENEIKLFCRELDETLNQLLKNSDKSDFNEIIFYKKLRADYLRYFCEISNDDEVAGIVEVCEESYKEVYLLTQEKLSSHDTLTLSVALNYSFFAYFNLGDTKKAFEIADKATKAADKNMNKIDNQDDKEYRMLYKSLEENLTIWKIDLFEDN